MSHSLHDGTTAPLWSALAVFRRVGVQRFTAVDIVTLVYVTFATAAVLAFSGEDHASWDLLLTAHALVVVLVLIAPRAREAGAVGRFLGDWYPMVLLAGLYAEVGVVNVDLGVQHDQIIQRLPSTSNPIGWLVACLAMTVGLPFLVVATTAPKDTIPAAQLIPRAEKAVASGSAVPSSLAFNMPVNTTATEM